MVRTFIFLGVGFVTMSRNVTYGRKMGQISPKWDKSGTFSNQNSVHFRLPSQNVLNYELKIPGFVPFDSV